MPTYKAMQREAGISSRFVPKTCEIAHFLELLGEKPRVAPNRIDRSLRKYPSPPKRQAAIIGALPRFEQHDLGSHGGSL